MSKCRTGPTPVADALNAVGFALVSGLTLDALADGISIPTLAAQVRALNVKPTNRQKKIAGYAVFLFDKFTNTNTPRDEMERRIAREFWNRQPFGETAKIVRGSLPADVKAAARDLAAARLSTIMDSADPGKAASAQSSIQTPE